MEAATSPWRPIGQFLVERNLITEAELEQALAEQEETGGRLGQILVARGWISGPELAAAVSEQLGIELETESGFGAGLFDEIRRRHAAVRGLATTPEPEPAARAQKPQLHLVQPEASASASPAEELAELRARVVELEEELERERATRAQPS